LGPAAARSAAAPVRARSAGVSTTAEACAVIFADGEIGSWNALKRSRYTHEPAPIGCLLGDLADFSDFVMLGSGVAGEIEVSSRRKGRICMDEHCAYQPGARLSVDVAALARDGLSVRDGAH
jgi:hypothetical protein